MYKSHSSYAYIFCKENRLLIILDSKPEQIIHISIDNELMIGVIIFKNQMMLAKIHFNKVEILNSLNGVFLSTTVMVSDVNDFL